MILLLIDILGYEKFSVARINKFIKKNKKKLNRINIELNIIFS